MKGIVAAIILVLCGTLHAQTTTGTIEGLVIDSVSLQPISGATITVEGTKLGAVSRDSGQWLITSVPAGDVKLRVHAIGYREHVEHARLHAGEKISLFIGLVVSMSMRQEDVVITASKHLQLMQEVPISTSIVSGSDVGRRNAIQLDQLLRYVPGVNLNDNQVNIRGSSGYSRGLGSRVLLLADGVPMLAGDTGEMKMDAVPMIAIDRVEVVKGAGSALYGSSALGGVVNIVTRVPDSLRMYAKIYGGGCPAPSYDAWKWYSGVRTQSGIDGGIENKFDALSISAYGGYHTSDGYRQNDDFRRWNFYTKLGKNFTPQLSVWLVLTAANEDHGNWIFWRDEAHALLASDSTTLYQRIYSFKLQTSAIVKYFLTDDIISWFRAGFYRTNVDDNINAIGPDSASKLVSHAHSYSIEEQLTHQLSEKTLLTYGVQSTGNVVKSNYYGDRAQWDAALYAQAEHRPDSRVVLTLGARGTIAKTDTLGADTRVDPKFGVSFSVDEDCSLRASAGTGFRTPSIGERFVATRTGTLITKPNPNLQFERSVSFEIGGVKTFHLGAMPLTIDAAIFWNDYWNLIEPDFVCGFPAQIQFVNVTRARIQGVDLHGTAPLLDRHLTFTAAYTYMWGRSIDENTPLKYRPRHLCTAGLKTAWGAFFGGADFRYASRVERVDDAVVQCINPLTGYSVIPDFDKRGETMVTDAHAGIDLNPLAGLPFVFTLNVYNLFQYYYVEIPANLAPIRNVVAQVEFIF